MAESWLDYALNTAKNFPSSLGNQIVGMAKGIGHTIAHPLDTLGSFGELGGSAYEALHPTKGDTPQQHAVKTAAANAAWDQFVNKYATKDEQGNHHFDLHTLGQTIENDPASILSDAAMILPIGGGSLGLAGKMADVSGAARAAKALNTAGQYVTKAGIEANPLMVSGRAINATSKLPVINKITSFAQKLPTEIQSGATGVPAPLLKAAKTAASAPATGSETPAQIFKRFQSGQGSADEIFNATNKGLNAIRAKASADYLAGRQGLLNQPVDMTPIWQAYNAARTEVNKGSTLGFPKAKAALDDAENLLMDVATNPDPAARNVENMDMLKRQIWDLRDQHPNPTAQQYMNNIYHGTKAAIAGVDPAYADLMENYQASLAHMNDLQKALRGTANTSPSQVLTKQMRSIKTPNGADLFSELSQAEPSLPFMLAGEATRSWTPSGLGPTLSERLGELGSLAGAIAYDPKMLGLIPLQRTLQSPRAMGNLNYAAGKVAKTLPSSVAIPTTANLAGQFQKTQDVKPLSAEEFGVSEPVSDALSIDDFQPIEAVEREAHASGGKVGHQHLVDRLMKLANKAKHDVDASSKPLLQADDSSIAHALAVANRSI